VVIVACNLKLTRIVGHLDLAEVYANEFLSDVTDGAVFGRIDQRHTSSSSDKQNTRKGTRSLPSGK
jgi:hypothetical protein